VATSPATTASNNWEQQQPQQQAKYNGGLAMLGYVRNAGTCKMVYDSVPYLPLTPLVTPFSPSSTL